MAQETVEAGKRIEDPETGEKEKVTGKVYYDAGSDLEEMKELFGEDLVYKSAKNEIHRKLKSAIRRELKNGTDPEDIPENLKDWRPDTPHTVSKSPDKQAEEAFNAMSEEQQLKKLKELEEKISAKQ